MLKHFLAVVLLLVMVAGSYSQSIPSGTGRYSPLGSSPFILDAHIDMLNNPAWNNYYRDYAFGDLTPFVGSESDGEFNGHAGVTFAVGKKWNLGMIINKRQDLYGLFNSYSGLGANIQPNNQPIVPFMGLIGVSASKTLHLGLAPYIAMGNSERTDTSGGLNVKNSSMSFGANLGMIYMIKKGWVEGAIRFRMNSFENDSTVGGVNTLGDNDGGLEFGIGLRAWIYPKKGSKVAIVPLLGFSMYNFTPRVVSGSVTVLGSENSYMNINGGVGLNWPVIDDIQIAGGVTLAYNTAKATYSDTTGSYENKATDFVAPGFNMAVETRIAEWLTGRMGFSKAVNTGDFETNTQTFSNLLASSVASTFSLGAGFHFGRFSIDATVNERWFKNGINFVSGESSELFGEMSASYNFNK
jgi:hypothetical protein